MVTPIQVTPEVRPQRKNLKGRPKKSFNHMPDLTSSPLSVRSKEAQNTWDTAKILGISAADEQAVISGFRKSKRLLIMDGKQT